MAMSFRSAARLAWPALILGALAACSSVPLDDRVPVEDKAAKAPAPPASAPSPGTALLRSRARWVAVDWNDLPGWDSDRTSELWPALMRSCEKPPFEWARLCSDARKSGASLAGDAAVRTWLQQRLSPYRVESLEGATDGLATGYFEPLVEARRTAQGPFRVPLYMTPADLATRKPWWTRQQLDTQAGVQAQLKGHELAFVADPLDALILQIQGSGRLQITEADGTRKLVRAAFAGHNDQPYKSVGKWLIEQGELKPEQASWPAIKAWARMNPKRVNELLWSNPRVVFFKEEPIPDPAAGPRGAQGVPLSPGRSIAVDAQSVPYGTPVWLDTTEPLSNTPLRRVVLAQDTGTAITGAVRADYFWGWGEQAEQQAGRMKQPLRMWVLWPRS
ncbi:murein transglycosylase A [Piscinibacter terrae]|nr:MltA domain-containing protein [Albitalea terrae]